ncbi:MAG TPA: biopolymer transporter ExbD [Bacillota bacterium]|jgi:biopolymer transport protein ExbD|nr:biopolymer transporter ExbD [Bacillota bacterium]
MNIQVPRQQPRLEITNAIDIMFFMLIFFMLFTTFHSQQTGMDVKLPQAETGEATAVEDFIISVDADRQLYWQGQPIALAELESMIKMQLQENPQSRFIVQADRTIQYDDLVKVLDRARLAGGTQVALAVQPLESSY